MSWRETKRGVEADVVHRTRHRLEPDHFRAFLCQPLDAGRENQLADALSLIIRRDSQRTHPALDAGAMDHVERRDSIPRIAPDHRAFFGISNSELPYRR